MPLAVLYARFSPRPNAEECDSVEKQLERCRAYSLGHGYTVVAQHHDKDLSGARADNRPGLQSAIAAACKRKAVLVVYSLSRLARCTRDAIDLAASLRGRLEIGLRAAVVTALGCAHGRTDALPE